MSYIPIIFSVALVAVLVFVARFRLPSKIPTTRDGAVLALSQILEWSKWMAGIQTAALGALAVLVFKADFSQVPRLSLASSIFALSGFMSLGSALFCSAWILGSIPSLSIRIYANEQQGLHESNDVYELPLFAWSNKLPLGYVLSINHWLWGAGLVSLALVVAKRLLSVE